MKQLKYVVIAFVAFNFANARAFGQVQCNPSDNPIQCENRQPGTSGWQLTSPVPPNNPHLLEGYASKTSVNVGEPIDLYINATPAVVGELEVFRMGWYPNPGPAPAGARRVYGPVSFNAGSQEIPCPTDRDSGLVECRWPLNTTLQTASFLSAVSGYYLVRLSVPNRNNANLQSYIIFVVREDNRDGGASYLMNSAVTTYQAYNAWGGYSFYESPDGGTTDGGTASKLSFDRPYTQDQGTGQFFDPYASAYADALDAGDRRLWSTTGFEYPMVRFLEREGYDVTYATDIDLHANPSLLTNAQSPRKAFLSVGHDEYWSKNMHDNLETARDGGTHIAFFSGNSVFWIINILPRMDQTRPNRIIQTYVDPPIPQNPLSNPWLWQNCAQLPGPYFAPRCTDTGEESEQTLVGSITTDGSINRGDIVFTVDDFAGSASWVVQGAMLSPGDRLPGMIGYEAQNIKARPTPPNQTKLAHSRFKSRPQQWATPETPEYLWADMSLYRATSGAWVFSSGGPDWSLGFDIFSTDFPETAFHRVHPAIGQITRNILARFGNNASPPPLTTRAYSVSVLGTCFTPGQLFTVQVTAPAGRPNCQLPWCDAISIYNVLQNDDAPPDSRTYILRPAVTVQAPQLPGTYTADYVTLDRTWDSLYTHQEGGQQVPDQLRTIWRGAKSSTFCVSNTCPCP
jgi:hypothetical protein